MVIIWDTYVHFVIGTSVFISSKFAVFKKMFIQATELPVESFNELVFAVAELIEVAVLFESAFRKGAVSFNRTNNTGVYAQFMIEHNRATEYMTEGVLRFKSNVKFFNPCIVIPSEQLDLLKQDMI